MDTRRLRKQVERHISLSGLSRLGCSRSILSHGIFRYCIAESLPQEKREALGRAGISEKQLRAMANRARSLADFLDAVRSNSHFVIANDIPHGALLGESRDLRLRAEWLESLKPFRPNHRDEGLLAMALHIEQTTGNRQLDQLCKVLNDASAAVTNGPGRLTVVALRKRPQRADHTRAVELLEEWQRMF